MKTIDDFTGRVIWGRAEDALADVPDGTVDLCSTDPPFNLGIEYPGYDDAMPVSEFYAMLRRTFLQVRRVLKPDGSLFVAMCEEHHHRLRVMLEEMNFHWRNTIVWHYTFGPHQKGKFGRDHTPILYMVLDPKRFTFNADAVRVPSARQAVYNDTRADPRGRVPGDVWTFSRVCGTFKERIPDMPCQQPLALQDRIVRVASNPDGVVLDPFCGSSTTLEAAARLGRKWLGIDVSAKACKVSEARLAAAASR